MIRTFSEYCDAQALESLLIEAITLEAGESLKDNPENQQMLGTFVNTLKRLVPSERMADFKSKIQQSIDKIRGGGTPIDFSTVSKEADPQTVAMARKFGGPEMGKIDDESLSMWLAIFNRDLRNHTIGDDLSKISTFGSNLTQAQYFRKFADWFKNRAFHSDLPKKTSLQPLNKTDVAAILTRTAGRIINDDPFSQEAVITALKAAIQNDEMFQRSLAYLNRATNIGKEQAANAAPAFINRALKQQLVNKYGIENPTNLFPKNFQPNVKYSDIQQAIKDTGMSNQLSKLRAQAARRQKKLNNQQQDI